MIEICIAQVDDPEVSARSENGCRYVLQFPVGSRLLACVSCAVSFVMRIFLSGSWGVTPGVTADAGTVELRYVDNYLTHNANSRSKLRFFGAN